MKKAKAGDKRVAKSSVSNVDPGRHSPALTSIPPRLRRHPMTRGALLPGWPHLNSEALAEETGYGLQHLREVLTGRTRGSIQAYIAIADALGINVQQLLDAITRACAADQQRPPQKKKKK